MKETKKYGDILGQIGLYASLIAGASLMVYEIIIKGESFGDIIKNKDYLPHIITVVAIFFISVFVIHSKIMKKISKFWKHTKNFFTGNSKILDSMKKCHEIIYDAMAFKEFSNTAKVLLLDYISQKRQKVNIFYSHRGNEIHNRIKLASKSSSIPLTLEEKNLCMRTWGLAYSYIGLENVELFCSCECPDLMDFRDKLNNISDQDGLNDLKQDQTPDMLKTNLILIGSSNKNIVTKVVLAAARLSSQIKYSFIIETEGDQQKAFLKDFTTEQVFREAKKGEIQTDYGILARFENPFKEGAYVFLLSGCRAAGAWAIEHFFFNYDVIDSICNEYIGRREFTIIIKTKWERADNAPKLLGLEGEEGKVELEIVHPKNFKIRKKNILEINQKNEKMVK